VIVLVAGIAPHATVISNGAVIVGKAAGLTVIVLLTEAIGRPQASFAEVQVSVTVPPHAGGVAEKVEEFEVPLSSQPPLNPLLEAMVLAAGMAPHATVISAGAVIVGKAAGLTVIVLLTEDTVLPQRSVAVQVSVTVPPHAGGVALNVEVLDGWVIQPPLLTLL
jgi:hypothetical protein